MAVRVHYTSTIDKILILPRLVVSGSIFGLILWGVISLIEYFDIPNRLKINEFLSVVFFLLMLLFCSIITASIYSKTAGRFFFILSAYLYLRFNLHTPMSWKDSGFVAFLFTPNETGKWYPMTDVLKLEKDLRQQYILKFAENVLKEYLDRKDTK